jgi:HEAT repeat protein
VLPTLKESHCITALEALGRLGTQEACEAVRSFADHPSPQIRKFVVVALSRIGSPAAEERLRQMAREDPKDWVRDFAAKRVKA